LSCREYGGDGVGDGWLKPFKITLSDFPMKGYPDMLRWGPDELSENELGPAEGTSQRVESEGGFEQVAPRAVERARAAVELLQKSVNEGEELAADALGQKAVIADVAEIAVRNVSDQPSEKVENGERKGWGGVGIVVEIGEHDGLAVVGLDA
jgi:hypothetical protein